MGVATQMGNQFTALNAMRQAAYRIRAGQVGTVKEVHVWTNRPVWPQGGERPASAPVPKEVDWESWIGPAPMRDYADGAYHDSAGAAGGTSAPARWATWRATRATCRSWRSNMRNPTSVEATSSANNKDSYPDSSKITFEFPELDGRAAFTLHWADKSQ